MLSKLALITLSAAIIACAPTSSASAILPTGAAPTTTAYPMPIAGEPSLAGAYLTAYARGDLPAADQLASPLNQIEWSRRGFSVTIRQTLLPDERGPDGAWLAFHYVGGTWDGAGFGHLLYLGVPVGARQPLYPSAWRVDLDPQGRVIWAELVYMFAANTPLAIVHGNASDAGDLPPSLVSQEARLIAGVRAPTGQESYDILAVPSRLAAGTIAIRFAGVDAAGQLRPGAWSYGVENSVAPYGQPSPPRSVALERDLAQLLASYLVDCES